jgi:hypothetical protein
MTRIVLCLLGLCLLLPSLSRTTFSATPDPPELNVRDFGAAGDGVTNDGPAFQAALDALATAGGGTLFVPEGKYAITTPVTKNFAGLASSITIKGVESLTPVTPTSSTGNDLAEGLGLLTEVYPRTGVAANAFSIYGLQSLVVKDIAFVGTEGVDTDAANTLYFSDIEKAQVKHSEFNSLATIYGGSIVSAERSDLEVTQCKFLGSTATSGAYAPVVQNVEWYGITISDSVFLDYGLREIYGKTYLAAPISWVNIGNAAAVTNHSPRREAVIRDTFLDEGGYWGLSSLPYRYTPPSAPINLIYITGLQMNVSNFGQYGHLFYDTQRVFIENSRYGWSHNASGAIALANVNSAILDKLTCEADADHIVADALTGELTVINSTYTQLDSQAQTTNALTTAPEDDPVQYVRSRFTELLGREPDPAAHFYWSDLLIHCFTDSACVGNVQAALNDYLSQQPAAKFAISGRITNKDSSPVPGVQVTVSGSQSVTTTTDANGNYDFTNLPTSGRYVITPAKNSLVFESPSETLITPSGDRSVNFTSITPPVKHSISGHVVDAKGGPLAGVAMTLSGSVSATTTTLADGSYSFSNVIEGSSCTVTALKSGYLLTPPSQTFDNLSTDATADFQAALLPVLLTEPDSERAIALELTTFIADPFPITSTFLSGGHDRTRVVFFAKDLGLLPGEGVEVITAEAEDAAHVKYPLRVEFVSPLPELQDVNQLVIRMTGDLEDAGDVLVTITVHGLPSNKAQIAIGHFSDILTKT